MTSNAPQGTVDKKSLRLNYSGRIIDHLGIQMYQSPVAAIAELIANAWDADAENVYIELPKSLSADSEIVIKDDGLGMSFTECEERFLNVGYSRRGTKATERSPGKGRQILGRKGIGKFAGFGIAQVIQIETVNKKDGERTVFEMDLEQLRSDSYVNLEGSEVAVVNYQHPDNNRIPKHGTTIRLRQLSLIRNRNSVAFARSMARRFLIHQSASDFRVRVNGELMPESHESRPIQFSFPKDYKPEERPDGININNNGWGIEKVDNHEISWRVQFFEAPINDEDLRGISVFAGIKMVQSPFFFNLSGGLRGQHGQQYVSGKVQANFLDEQPKDIFAPERQRVDWADEVAEPLRDWGSERLKQLLRIWADRRAENKTRQLDQRTGIFGDRLNRFHLHEKRILKQAIRGLARIDTLSDAQFEDIGQAIISAWEQGRLKDLIETISTTNDLSADGLISILAEAQVLTSLNVAEAVKTKLLTVGELKQRINNRDLENAVRDYISDNPWLISPEWETFAVEKSVNTLTAKAMIDSGINADESFKGRVDLALSSGNHLIILEFMRPGLRLDWDHVNRFESYVRRLSGNIRANTGGTFNKVTGYIVADEIDNAEYIREKIESLQRDDMFAIDWDTLFSKAVAQWEEFLSILVERAPDDPRLQALRSD